MENNIELTVGEVTGRGIEEIQSVQTGKRIKSIGKQSNSTQGGLF